ncbi:chromosome segregation ATPase [Shewanella khirikhana]|uniref:chromosome segregation ATPase n=1 Tax=Shewanella khirikhana TaxID=1965282 RepID=UPI0030CB3884
MNALEIEAVFPFIDSFGVGAIIGGLIIYLFIKSFIPQYLSEKAKNLASKEDIETIADKVESVKSDYAHLLEEVKSNNQIKLAALEREKNTKKEVYIEAVEAITRSQNIITRFCNLNLSEEEITESLATDAGRIAKIQVVGDKETVKAVTEFMAMVGSSSLDLTLKRSALTQRLREIRAYESSCSKKQQEIDNYIALLKNQNIQGGADQRLWNVIDQNIKFDQEQINKYQKELSALWEIQRKEHLAYTRLCMDTFFSISNILPAVVLAVRKELDLDIAPEDYLNIFNENIKKGRDVFHNFLLKVEEKE